MDDDIFREGDNCMPVVRGEPVQECEPSVMRLHLDVPQHVAGIVEENQQQFTVDYVKRLTPARMAMRTNVAAVAEANNHFLDRVAVTLVQAQSGTFKWGA